MAHVRQSRLEYGTCKIVKTRLSLLQGVGFLDPSLASDPPNPAFERMWRI